MADSKWVAQARQQGCDMAGGCGKGEVGRMSKDMAPEEGPRHEKAEGKKMREAEGE